MAPLAGLHCILLTLSTINYSLPSLNNCHLPIIPGHIVPGFVRGLLTGKFKRNDPKTSESLAGTRVGWVAENPAERAIFSTPDIETLRNDENFWKLMDTVEAIAKKHGMCSKIVHCTYKLFKLCICRNISTIAKVQLLGFVKKSCSSTCVRSPTVCTLTVPVKAVNGYPGTTSYNWKHIFFGYCVCEMVRMLNM